MPGQIGRYLSITKSSNHHYLHSLWSSGVCVCGRVYVAWTSSQLYLSQLLPLCDLPCLPTRRQVPGSSFYPVWLNRVRLGFGPVPGRRSDQ